MDQHRQRSLLSGHQGCSSFWGECSSSHSNDFSCLLATGKAPSVSPPQGLIGRAKGAVGRGVATEGGAFNEASFRSASAPPPCQLLDGALGPFYAPTPSFNPLGGGVGGTEEAPHEDIFSLWTLPSRAFVGFNDDGIGSERIVEDLEFSRQPPLGYNLTDHISTWKPIVPAGAMPCATQPVPDSLVKKFDNLDIALAPPQISPPTPEHTAPSTPAPPSAPAVVMNTRLLLEEAKRRPLMPLSELKGHILDFSADQHGSRFIQQRLESANESEKALIFGEIAPSALSLMNDVFGNYVVQKFFEFGTPQQRDQLADCLKGKVLALSTQMYGCRVVQKALEHLDSGRQASLIKELEGHVLKCVKDQNGNHVIQKCIEAVAFPLTRFIIDAFQGQVASLATHPYGCRVIQRIFEHCPQTASLLAEFHVALPGLIPDQYGNYVVQHVLEHGNPADKAIIISKVKGHVLAMSRHKFASNVVEKCVAWAGAADRADLIRECLKPAPAGVQGGSVPLLAMMKDQYANYVVQKMLDVVLAPSGAVENEGQTEELREALLGAIKPHFSALRKFTYGKHIISKVEGYCGGSGGLCKEEML